LPWHVDKALFNPKTSFLIQKRHPYAKNLNSESSGTVKTPFLHRGAVLVLREERTQTYIQTQHLDDEISDYALPVAGADLCPHVSVQLRIRRDAHLLLTLQQFLQFICGKRGVSLQQGQRNMLAFQGVHLLFTLQRLLQFVCSIYAL